MISIVDVWKSVQATAKTSTSGYQTKDKFNSDVELVQLAIIKALCELYEKEQVISDDLLPFVVTLDSIPTDKPDDYYRFVTAEINGEEVYPLKRNSVSMTKTSPIRGSVKSYYFDKGFVQFITGGEDIEEAEFTYIRRPNVASIDMVYSDDGGDYVTPVKVEDLEWPESVRNLIEAMLLEKLGIESREIIDIEYGKLGIQRETSNYS